MKKEQHIINREISWLAFNGRVLQEAKDKSVPLLERLRFLGIFSNNRDEFFRVRVATVKRMTTLGKKVEKLIEESPSELLEHIQKLVVSQQKEFDAIYENLIQELKSQKIYIINEKKLDAKQGNFVQQYFMDRVLPTLAPIMLDTNPKFPYLKDKSIYLIIKLQRESLGKKDRYSLIEIPTDTLSRFLVLPKAGEETHIILLEDIIRFCLDYIFSIFEYKNVESYTIKLTRDAELDIDSQDVAHTLVEKIEKSLKKRKRGEPVRLVYDSNIAPDMLEFLTQRIKLRKEDSPIAGGRYHNFKDFISFPQINKALCYSIPHPLNHASLNIYKSIFRVLKKSDLLLSYPYHSFHHIIDLLREASIDPKVISIRMTLYRVAKESNVVNALINAAKNGKQVLVVMELRARFDEENNLYWANRMQEEGIIVIFGVAKLKVHSKLLLISRREGDEKTNFAHIGTGNFNEKTATIYSDFSLLTANRRLTSEVEKVFKFYENNLNRGTFKHLLVSPFNMRTKLVKLINNEIKSAKKGKRAEIFIKLNNLVDEKMIRKLYDASKAGVKIRMVIRGICSLVPGIKGLSENIEAISIIDKFLEHGRVFIFFNEGDEKYFLSSADWMTRNLDHRSEVAVPIYDNRLKQELRDIMEIQWSDNTKARVIDQKQKNVYRMPVGSKLVRSQDEIFKYLKQKKVNKVELDLRSN